MLKNAKIGTYHYHVPVHNYNNFHFYSYKTYSVDPELEPYFGFTAPRSRSRKKYLRLRNPLKRGHNRNVEHTKKVLKRKNIIFLRHILTHSSDAEQDVYPGSRTRNFPSRVKGKTAPNPGSAVILTQKNVTKLFEYDPKCLFRIPDPGTGFFSPSRIQG